VKIAHTCPCIKRIAAESENGKEKSVLPGILGASIMNFRKEIKKKNGVFLGYAGNFGCH
jgi:hypothetical protein